MAHDVHVFPTSFAQRRLWFLDQMSGGRPVYNVATEVEFEWLVAPGHFTRALQIAVERHESLRTTLSVVDGEPVQVVHPPASMAPVSAFDDLRSLPLPARQAAYARIANEVANAPFDLAGGPLLRARLVWMDEASAVAILVMHHISTDGWSSRILEEEVLLACDALRRQIPVDLPDVPVQYGDFAAWQRQQLAAGAADRVAWWRDTLRDAPAALTMPLDRARPALVSLDGVTLTFRLPARLSARLQELCQRAGVTGFMATLAAFKFLLAQHCGATDIVVGTAVAGRDHPGLDRTIGFFVNTVLLRTHLGGPLTFTQLLDRVRTVAMDAYAHQDLPFERLVAELAPDRQLALTPLFQAMFTYDPLDGEEIAEEDEPATSLEIGPASAGTAKFDLTLALAESPGGLSGVLEFNADIFGESTMRTWLRHFHALLEHAAAHPDDPLTAAAMLSESERDQVVNVWNRTAAPYPRDRSIHAIFDEVAARDPHAPAVAGPGGTISYGELLFRSELMAAALVKQGVRRGTLVGICASRSVELIVGMLAILKAGGGYVPLDPEYPVDRLRLMVDDTRLSIVLATEAHARILDGFPVTVVPLSNPGMMPDVHRAVSEPAVDGSDIAYVIYTSGSTGRPKGVAIPHRAVLRLVCNTDYVSLGPEDAIGHASNTSFDAATFEIWGALLNGSRLVIIDRELLLSPRDLVAFLRAERVTTLFITTPLFNQIAALDPGSFGCLRTLLFGGDAADPGAVRRVIRSSSPPARLANVYGPTETTTFATWHLIHDVPDGALSVPIGRPIANTTTYILDAERRPVPVGVTGELYIGGDGVGLGYLGLDEAAADRFVANPFGSRPDDRLYRTGDRARWLPDGAIEFAGRIDRQVKVRGFRVEPGEIESVLALCPGVRQVAVVPTASDAGRQLAAYISALPGTTLSAASVRQHVRARLPEYMVPTHFVLMPDLPLSANGKIDRAALPLPGGTDRAAAPFVAPRSDIEQLVAAAWREVLQQDRLSVDDNFFDVGGHSLLLIKVLERLRAQLPVELSVLDLFRFPTISSLAAEIADRNTASVAVSGPPMPPRTSATITDRAGMLRRALARPRTDVRIPPEAAS